MSYSIVIVRGPDKGQMRFTDGAVAVSTDCWWDPAVRIDPGDYTGYATRMASRSDGFDGGNREAIWLGSAVPYNGAAGSSGAIFIHKGTGPSWSDGCVVAPSEEVLKVWLAIEPKDAGVVTVSVRDEA